jgi:hypothetical protein
LSVAAAVMSLHSWMRRGYHVTLILSVLSTLAFVQKSAYTIFSTPVYAQQQTCLQNCFMNYGPNDSKLPGHLGCAWDGSEFLDSCVCRADLAQTASAFLTSCVSSACSAYPADVPIAISMYNSYCSVPVGNVATTTLPGGSPAPTVVVITTVYSSAGNAVTQTGSELRFVALVSGLVAIVFSTGVL